MAEGETRIENFSTAADCISTLSCLKSLGVSLRHSGSSLRLNGGGLSSFREPKAPLDAQNSGSTLRMLAGILAGCPFDSVLTGDASLRRRPVERVAVPLRAMGARLVSQDGRPPLLIEGGPLRGIDWDLEVASAQVKTAILFAGLQATGVTRVREPAPSRDHTEILLPLFGADLTRKGLEVSIQGGRALRGIHVTVPGDVSSAAFLVVAALVLPDSHVRIEDVVLSPGRTAFLDVLSRMGGRIEVGVTSTDPEPRGFITASTSALRGAEVAPDSVPGLIDEVPALAVAASHARGVFVDSGASELRLKESDRIASLAEGLARLGARVAERPDGFQIEGGHALTGTHVRSHGDHRIAMALVIAGLSAAGTTSIEGAEAIAVSFPEFVALLEEGLGHSLA
jgi:3-phosphoshikimate 1-carboxyvinyltransferase